MSALVSYSDSDDVSSSDEDACSPVKKRQKKDDTPQWTRNFPHVDGNWPSYVYFKVPMTSTMRTMMHAAMEDTQARADSPLSLVQMDNDDDDDTSLHLSLSRTFVLKFEQIEPFVQALRLALKYRKRFRVSFHGHRVLLNDELTRLFVTIPVSSGKVDVVRVIRCVDTALARFGLQEYYADPIPHLSVASSTTILPSLCDQDDTSAPPPPVHFDFVHVHATIGNKHFSIPLLDA
ncbi:Aste57867_10901 [Aphanomyces stellatus]|uniref:U6 snRNA phosphodiesterase 1 n=1 Tax=Aphanomyces stellatus TaxID=120398 RepID=A0A485KSQ1_9STRA|nr:hypothetical protein As57867_010861 [Aphanomyces stellatus]VFT87769.1 Aste57867_10901 [Aphanomyces stellatus]